MSLEIKGSQMSLEIKINGSPHLAHVGSSGIYVEWVSSLAGLPCRFRLRDTLSVDESSVLVLTVWTRHCVESTRYAGADVDLLLNYLFETFEQPFDDILVLHGQIVATAAALRSKSRSLLKEKAVANSGE